MQLSPGDVFEHFEIIEHLGEGGMGVVYRAHDTKLGRDVALKFLTEVGQSNTAYSDRLRREARSLAALHHANIVTIFDIGDAEGVPYLVLEWVSGGPLPTVARSHPLSVPEFFSIAKPIAAALGAAHDRGVTHRDVKLVDFGLAKSQEFDQDTLKTVGVVGTIAYMSPGRPRVKT